MDSFNETYFALFWYLPKEYSSKAQFINKHNKIPNCAWIDGVGISAKESSPTLNMISVVINKNELINIHKDVDFISLNDLWLEIAKKAKEINMNANDTPMNISKEYAM